MIDPEIAKRARIMLGMGLAKDAEQIIASESFYPPDRSGQLPFRDYIHRVEITIYSKDLGSEPYQAGVDIDFPEKPNADVPQEADHD